MVKLYQITMMMIVIIIIIIIIIIITIIIIPQGFEIPGWNPAGYN